MKGKSKGWSGSPKHTSKTSKGGGHVGGVAGSPDSGKLFRGVTMNKAASGVRSGSGKSPSMGKPYTEE